MLDRRSTLKAAAAFAAAVTMFGSAPAASAARRKAPRLKAGDVVGLIEPAGYADGPGRLERVEATIRGMGLVPRRGRNIEARYGYLAGTDEQRAADFNDMFADDDVRAVFAVRGGWGSARILPLLDWKTIRANPKLLIGFSDITALHLAFAARAGFPTIHGPNAASSWPETSWNSFWTLAFAGAAPTFSNVPADPMLSGRLPMVPIRTGKARGKLIGANLTVLSALMGTRWLPDFDGAILFLEDVGEAEYRIDRMLTQRALAGVLGKVAGVVFGQCTRCTTEEPDYAGFTIGQVLQQHLEPLGIPAFYGANIGHVANQISMPMGVEAEIDGGEGSIRILEPVTA